MVLLQAMIALAVLLLLVLGIALLIGVPLFVIWMKRLNYDAYQKYSLPEKIAFFCISFIMGFVLIAGIVFVLFSLIDISIT